MRQKLNMSDTADLPEEVILDFRTLDMRTSLYRSIEEIRKQFKTIALKVHPDKSELSKAESTELFQKINKAYERLITFVKKKSHKSKKEKNANLYQSYDLKYKTPSIMKTSLFENYRPKK